MNTPAQTRAMVAGSVTLSLALGTRAAFGLLLVPLAAQGISVANVALAIALHNLAWGLFQPVAGAWADRMIRHGRSATFVRKLLQAGSLLSAALFLLLLQGAGSVTMGMLLMCGASGALAFCLAGFAPNSFDIAPRHADVIWGISNTFGTMPGIVGVAVTGWLVDRTGGYTAPFLLTAGVSVVGAIVFLLFGSGERQID